MSDHTTPDDEISALLVFYANETLEGSEKQAVEAALAADADLRAELDALRALRTEMQADRHQSTPVSTPGEFGLARLMRRIDNEQIHQQRPSASRSRIWQVAAAAAIALFVGQSALVVFAPGRLVEFAGGSTERAQGPTLKVAFAGQVVEADIRALLLELNLVIVDGPSALGLYVLAARDDAARNAALIRLQASPAIVDSAEPED